MPELYFSGRKKQDFHHIEPYGCVRNTMTVYVDPGTVFYMSLLRETDGFHRFSISAIPARLYFDKNQGTSILHNQVNFSMSSFEISCQINITFTLQILTGKTFPFPPKC